MITYKNIANNENTNTNNLFDTEVNKYLNEKKKETQLCSLKFKHNILRLKIVNWLLTDFDDNLAMIDYLKISFDYILKRMNIVLNDNKYIIYFTLYCNWVFKNSNNGLK